MKTWTGYLGLLHLFALCIVLGAAQIKTPGDCPAPPLPTFVYVAVGVWLFSGVLVVATVVRREILGGEARPT